MRQGQSLASRCSTDAHFVSGSGHPGCWSALDPTLIGPPLGDKPTRSENVTAGIESARGSAPVCRSEIRDEISRGMRRSRTDRSRISTLRNDIRRSTLQPRNDLAGDDLDLLVLVLVGDEDKLLRPHCEVRLELLDALVDRSHDGAVLGRLAPGGE